MNLSLQPNNLMILQKVEFRWKIQQKIDSAHRENQIKQQHEQQHLNDHE